MRIFIDIETAPSQQAGAREQVRATIRPPATLKKAESLSAWMATEADGAAEIAYRKQALDGGTFGEIISIAMTTECGKTWVKCRTQEQSEALLLADFGREVVRWIDESAAAVADGFNYASDPHFVAHNATFDVYFLWRRHVVNGIRAAFKLPSPSARVGRDFSCTMLEWAGFGGKVSLDSLCRALSIESPKDDGVDGSKVFDLWLAGEYEKIEQYNLKDAIAVGEIWNRMQGGGAAWAG